MEKRRWIIDEETMKITPTDYLFAGWKCILLQPTMAQITPKYRIKSFIIGVAVYILVKYYKSIEINRF